jgi:hypothetical protein
VKIEVVVPLQNPKSYVPVLTLTKNSLLNNLIVTVENQWNKHYSIFVFLILEQKVTEYELKAAAKMHSIFKRPFLPA